MVSLAHSLLFGCPWQQDPNNLDMCLYKKTWARRALWESGAGGGGRAGRAAVSSGGRRPSPLAPSPHHPGAVASPVTAFVGSRRAASPSRCFFPVRLHNCCLLTPRKQGGGVGGRGIGICVKTLGAHRKSHLVPFWCRDELSAPATLASAATSVGGVWGDLGTGAAIPVKAVEGVLRMQRSAYHFFC